MKQLVALLVLFASLLAAVPARAQAPADPALANEIFKIKAIDNHAHPLKYVADGEKPDDEFDALPLDAVESFPLSLASSWIIRNTSGPGGPCMATLTTIWKIRTSRNCLRPNSDCSANAATAIRPGYWTS